SPNATWTPGVGWVGSLTPSGSGNLRGTATIEKTFSGQLPVGWAGGLVFSSLSNCGTASHHWFNIKDGVNVGGGQNGYGVNGDNNHMVWTRSTNSPYVPTEFDKVQFHVTAVCCGCGPD